MKQLLTIGFLGVALAFPAAAELTRQQKIDDFNYLVAVLNRNYAAYEWKRNALGFEMLDVAPWRTRIERTRDDFEYLDLITEYMAQFRDTNTFVVFPSDFRASLGFAVDLYDGKALIDTIDREQLTVEQFPFERGDELVSLDGKTSAQWVDDLIPFSIESNPRANRRLAAEMITLREQVYIPRAGQLGDSAKLVIRRTSGAMETVDVAWKKEGTPLGIGPIPEVRTSARTVADPSQGPLEFLRRFEQSDSAKTKAAAVAQPAVTAPGLRPLYDLPAGFTQRLGRAAVDAVFSGTYESEGKRIGYMRFAAFSSQRDLDTEFNFMQQNTDGLVIDMMRAGGSVCAQERIAARLLGRTFQQPGFQLRATLSLIDSFKQNLELAELFGLPADTIRYYEQVLDELQVAHGRGERLTYPLPFCGTSLNSEPVLAQGSVVAYRKPVLLITDEFSADFLPAALKDNGRSRTFGMTTRASTGFTNRLPGPALIEADVIVKEAIMARTGFVKADGFPDSPYVENIGVRPDIEADFMTVENLQTKGKPFVDAFTKAIVDMVAAGVN